MTSLPHTHQDGGECLACDMQIIHRYVHELQPATMHHVHQYGLTRDALDRIEAALAERGRLRFERDEAESCLDKMCDMLEGKDVLGPMLENPARFLNQNVRTLREERDVAVKECARLLAVAKLLAEAR